MNKCLGISPITPDHHPINVFYHVETLRHSAGKLKLSLVLRDEHINGGGPSCGSLGVIVEYATKLASLGLMELCSLVEYEVSFIASSTRKKFVVNAEIDYSHQPNALFYCRISEAGSSGNVVAVAHGILLGRDAADVEPHLSF